MSTPAGYRPLTAAQDAAVKRFKETEADMEKFIDKHVKLGANETLMSAAKVRFLEARMLAVEAVTAKGHYAADTAAAPAAESAKAVAEKKEKKEKA